MKKAVPVIIAVALIFVIVAITFGMKLIERFSYSDERMDLDSYFGLAASDEAALVLNDEIREEKGVIKDGRCYLPLETVHLYLNERFYADYNEGWLLYTTPDEIIYARAGEAGEDGYVPAFLENGVMYVALDYVKKYTNFSYTLYAEPNRVVMTTVWDEHQAADIKKDTAVRYQGGIKSDILTEVKAGDQVTVLDQMETWSQVATRDGFIGYVENKRLENERSETLIPVTDYVEPEYTSIHRDHKISLGWHQVTSEAANSTLDEVLEGVSGMNVISPTWFFLSDNEGSFVSIGSSDYVQEAHARGLEVWALLDNFTYDVDTREILSYTSKRQKLIEGLINEALSLGVDGINVDLEQVPSDAGEDYIEFIRELSIPCRANGLVLSVDNYVPKNYNAHYHWEEQGIVADYVIIMGYDEHYGGSQETGSVASINYVEEGISTMVQQVPSEKVVNAVPFYTRIWETTADGVKSQAVGMTAAEDFLAQRGVEPVWDDATCQNYAEFEENGAFFQVWLEDAESLQVKINVMKEYGIGGVAAWKLGYESGHPEVWAVISDFVNS
ncbi:MAG TPA: SH3 domain-containing protein [Candidatus Eisenbergiella merdipullorum]|uniref:SH3 domain-containing protein n=1 Tax=Candidatus Eisenbergiella merdipullorum TaxID=2838553 RepID=A0A9D2I3D0_9FIRM|nr:SH3 domain-containing protein [Candidatus Eisenbergiella merdipullorum]